MSSPEEQLETLSRRFEDAERAARLMANEDFLSFWEGELHRAERYCVTVIEQRKSNFEKNEAAGIIRYLRRKLGELSHLSDPEVRKRLLKKLEALNGRLGEIDGVSTGGAPDPGWSTDVFDTF